MKKPKPEVKKELEKLASLLPKLELSTFEVRRMTSGYQEELNNEDPSKKFKPNGKYVSTESIGHPIVNHYKRMRAIWIKSNDENQAWANVRQYYSEVMARFGDNNPGNFNNSNISNEKV